MVVLEPLVEQLVEDSVSKCTRTFMEKQLWDHSDHNSEHHRKRKHVGPQQALLRAWGDVLFFFDSEFEKSKSCRQLAFGLLV